MPDAVVIGAGPNGLVAANLLADRGWDVLVLEEQSEPGGAVRSGEVTAPGYTSDLFSAFYPFAAASPAIQSLGLARHGLEWCRAPLALAHPRPDGRAALISSDLEESAGSFDRLAPGDGDAWQELMRLWERTREGVMEAFTTPLPPVRALSRLVRRLGAAEALDFARFGLLPARRLSAERFTGEAPGLLIAGNALHVDLPPELPGSGLFGWLLCALAQDVGFPTPRGGAGALTAALVARLRASGGRLECGQRVTAIEVARRRAVGVRTAGGERVAARRAVLADVGAPQLYLELLPSGSVPAGAIRRARRFQYDAGTFKLDWALDRPIPWTSSDVRRSGTVHVAEDLDALTRMGAELAGGRLPSAPYLVLGQYSMLDSTRAPAGGESAWAYTHVPWGKRFSGDEADEFAALMENQVERWAPGFRDSIVARHVLTPERMEAENRNLAGGALGGGTAQLHQQLVLRPIPGLGRPETPVRRLLLCSASAHPGGGVHGGPGAIAARAALRRVPG